MTNKKNMKRIINNDFNKNNNHQVIINKIENEHKKVYLEYAIVPVILVIVVLIILSINNNQIKSFKDDAINTKNIELTSNNEGKDYDEQNNNYSTNIIVNELKEYKNKQDNSNIYLNNINIPYFEVLNNIKIPVDFDVFAEGHGVCIPKDKDYGKINNYEFWYKNSKNKRSIVIALSDKFIPYRDFLIDRKNSNKTIINGVDVEIYKFKNTYVSLFNYNGYNFDIESCDIMKEEYIMLLYSLIK